MTFDDSRASVVDLTSLGITISCAESVVDFTVLGNRAVAFTFPETKVARNSEKPGISLRVDTPLRVSAVSAMKWLSMMG